MSAERILRTFYATFGQNHDHPNGYVEIEATDEEKARGWMFAQFGSRWAFVYEGAEGWEATRRWGLYRVAKVTITELVG